LKDLRKSVDSFVFINSKKHSYLVMLYKEKLMEG
jgi:hypothetical protein